MGNLQSSPSSSNTVPRKKYDVFLSFRGADTRDCFTSHLYDALCRKQIETFIDYQIEKGDELSSALMTAIKESKISVVIFSTDYATAKWCLRELVEILECKKMNNQIVLPVFYGVDPSVVRHQTGSFEDSFVEHEKNLQKEVKTWRDALAEACGIIGWHSSDGSRTDAELVDEIVDDIWEKLMSGYISPDFEGRIGLERIKHVISLLCLHVTTDVRIIGIWGMGGIGKTTLANDIFNKYSDEFDGFCFIQNVRERLANSGGLVSVQKEILSKVLKHEDIKLDSLTIPPKIKERLNCLKVFIVLDDVDNFSQMKTLVGDVGGLGQGSRIIITSRNKQVLRKCCGNDDNIYEVKGFNRQEAFQLFCNHAFGENCHIEDPMVPMVNRLVNFSNGNPLALIVLGSLLYGKSEQEWESVVNKFEPANLCLEIFDILEISYNRLTDREKGIFLDIACFLKGREKDYVEIILNDCHYSLSVLIDKALITISSYQTIEMHDLLVEMGRDIVKKESTNEIGTRSRMWKQKDVLCTLKNDYGTPEVQGIFLDMSGINQEIHLSPRAFEKMYNLRLLKFYNSTYKNPFEVNFSKGLSDLSDELRSLIWDGYPFQELPSNFNPNNLIELDLCDSNLESLWEDSTPAPKLRWLNLSGCKRVTKIPDLSESPLLEEINLRDCSSLLDFPQLAQHMEYLVELDLSGCSNLKRLWKHSMEAPKLRRLNLSGCTSVTEIQGLSKSPLLESIKLKDCSSLLDFPQLAQHLKNLRKLDGSGCNSLGSFPSDIHFEFLTSLDLSYCNNLTKFPQIYGNNITRLNLSETAIKELHHSIAHLNGLEELFLFGCENLETLPSDIWKLTSLRHLYLTCCSRLEIFPENFGNLSSLKYLLADGIAICQLPYSMEGFQYSLRRLCLSDCNLDYIPKDIGCLFFLVELDLSENNFDGLPQSMRDLRKLESLHLDNCDGIVSLIDLPPNLKHLSACDCKQLQSIPNEGYFAPILNTEAKSKQINMLARVAGYFLKTFHQSIPNEVDFVRRFKLDYERKPTEFIFTNCTNLEETAVGNMLARLTKYLHQGDFHFSFCYLGREVPKWFTNINVKGSSIKFQETFDPNLKGFAVCAVIAFEKYPYNGYNEHKLRVHFDGTCSDGDQSSPTNIMSQTAYFASRYHVIDSDHVAFAYCDAHYRLKSYGDFGTRFKNYSFEFRLSEESPNCRLKSCGVCPIYVEESNTDDTDEAGTCGSRFYEEDSDTDDSDVAGTCGSGFYEEDSDTDDSDVAGTCGSRFDEEEMEPHPKENENLQTVKYAEPIEHIGETSGIKRSHTSNDHLEEEVEPHPKRLNI